MLEIVTEKDLRPILKRLEELEKWRERVQCPTCEGRGYINEYHYHNGDDWCKCSDCKTSGLRKIGKVYKDKEDE